MAFKLQETFVEIGARLSKLQSGLGKAKTMVVSGMKAAFSAATMAATAGAAGIAAALAGAIKLTALGSDLEEMRSKFTAVFKEEEGAAREFASGLAQGVGRSQVEIEG